MLWNQAFSCFASGERLYFEVCEELTKFFKEAYVSHGGHKHTEKESEDVWGSTCLSFSCMFLTMCIILAMMCNILSCTT